MNLNFAMATIALLICLTAACVSEEQWCKENPPGHRVNSTHEPNCHGYDLKNYPESTIKMMPVEVVPAEPIIERISPEAERRKALREICKNGCAKFGYAHMAFISTDEFSGSHEYEFFCICCTLIDKFGNCMKMMDIASNLTSEVDDLLCPDYVLYNVTWGNLDATDVMIECQKKQ